MRRLQSLGERAIRLMADRAGRQGRRGRPAVLACRVPALEAMMLQGRGGNVDVRPIINGRRDPASVARWRFDGSGGQSPGVRLVLATCGSYQGRGRGCAGVVKHHSTTVVSITVENGSDGCALPACRDDAQACPCWLFRSCVQGFAADEVASTFLAHSLVAACSERIVAMPHAGCRAGRCQRRYRCLLAS